MACNASGRRLCVLRRAPFFFSCSLTDAGVPAAILPPHRTLLCGQGVWQLRGWTAGAYPSSEVESFHRLPHFRTNAGRAIASSNPEFSAESMMVVPVPLHAPDSPTQFNQAGFARAAIKLMAVPERFTLCAGALERSAKRCPNRPHQHQRAGDVRGAFACGSRSW